MWNVARGQIMAEGAKRECDVIVPIVPREATLAGQPRVTSVLPTRAIGSAD